MASESATSACELAVGHRLVRVELHGGHRHLAGPLVGHAEHGAVEHRRMSEQHGLELGRRHLEAVDLDHLLRPVGQMDPALRLEPSDVAGPVPAVGEGLGGGVVGEVAGHHRRAARPGSRRPPRWQDLAAVEIGDSELDPGRRQSGRVEPPRLGTVRPDWRR